MQDVDVNSCLWFLFNSKKKLFIYRRRHPTARLLKFPVVCVEGGIDDDVTVNDMIERFQRGKPLTGARAILIRKSQMKVYIIVIALVKPFPSFM